MYKQRLTYASIDYQSEPMSSAYRQLDRDLRKAKDGMEHVSYKELSRADPFVKYKHEIGRKLGKSLEVSNAFLKCWELLTEFQLRPKSVFCNAEFPGSFIVALLYYAKEHQLQTKWVASSLMDKPSSGYHRESGILGDKYGLMHKFSKNWLMDKDNDGNVLSPSNLHDFARKIRERFENGVELYTSDIGIDVRDAPNDQESTHRFLNLAQVYAGMLCLAPGGTSITKTFTQFEPFSISVLAIQSHCFDDVYLVKPITSRSRNSEVYIVGRGFRGIPSYIDVSTIEKVITEQTLTPKDEVIGYGSFASQIEAICTPIITKQITVLDMISGGQWKKLKETETSSLNSFKEHYSI